MHVIICNKLLCSTKYIRWVLIRQISYPFLYFIFTHFKGPPPSIADFLSEYTGTIVSSDQIRVIHIIGEGMLPIVYFTLSSLKSTLWGKKGEFGVVYKAHLLQLNTRAEPQLVAVKTLKGAVIEVVVLPSSQ